MTSLEHRVFRPAGVDLLLLCAVVCPPLLAQPLLPGGEANYAWSPGFHRPGLNRTARAIVEFDDGSGPSLVVAGDFSLAGGLASDMIARWRYAPLVFLDGFEAGSTAAWSSTVEP